VSCVKISKNPKITTERKMYNSLKKFINIITDKQKSSLTPNCSKPLQLYGLPKIHKNEIPLWRSQLKKLSEPTAVETLAPYPLLSSAEH
jgi:hypothetical protein